MLPRLVVACASLVLAVVLARSARADPWVDAVDGRIEERLLDGEIDEDDLAALPHLGRARTGSGDLRARSWVSLVGFGGVLPDGTREVGALAVIGVALDRIAAGPVHAVRDRPPHDARPIQPIATDPPAPSAPSPTPSRDPPPQEPPLLLSPRLARATVAAAWRAAGLDASDARLDAIVQRARLSAALPETRLRALRSFDDRQHSDVVADQGRTYDTSGANLWLEARLTWRLDRLLYADDEPTLERVRLERQEARARIASHILELLFQWQRARIDLQTSQPRSRPELEATLRMLESEAALDVATAGWFTAARAAVADPDGDKGDKGDKEAAPPAASSGAARP